MDGRKRGRHGEWNTRETFAGKVYFRSLVSSHLLARPPRRRIRHILDEYMRISGKGRMGISAQSATTSSRIFVVSLLLTKQSSDKSARDRDRGGHSSAGCCGAAAARCRDIPIQAINGISLAAATDERNLRAQRAARALWNNHHETL